ncbi:hypothetical protein EMIT0324P_50316 [Pseudomonas chlororaphis]
MGKPGNNVFVLLQTVLWIDCDELFLWVLVNGFGAIQDFLGVVFGYRMYCFFLYIREVTKRNKRGNFIRGIL